MHKHGFTLIELLISVALIGIFLPAVMKSLSFSLMEARQGEQFSQAWTIARQGVEQKLAIKTSSWSSFVNGTNVDTVAPFTRTITVEDAYRCGGTTICKQIDPGAILDSYNGKIISSNVSWFENGKQQTVLLTSYVTQH